MREVALWCQGNLLRVGLGESRPWDREGGYPASCSAQSPPPVLVSPGPGVPMSQRAEVPGHTAFLSSGLGTSIHLLPLPAQAPTLGPPNSVAKALLPRAPDSEGTSGETPSRQPHPSEGGSLPWRPSRGLTPSSWVPVPLAGPG